MQKDGTFMITNNWLNKNCLPPGKPSGLGWGYDTFSYGFSITFLSRVEIEYIGTIFDGKKVPSKEADDYWKIMFNQDRHFSVKFLVLKEGKLRSWVPSLAIGICDPVTGAGTGDYIGSDVSYGNGYFNRFYVVATKHFSTSFGELGVHAGYQYSLRNDYKINAPCVGVNWKPVWLENRYFFPNFILEFDSRTCNFGFVSSIWDDRFEVMFLLQNMQWISAGLRFKVCLSK
ncbi:MAG: YjbH domain-containing protein [Bacteroidales bacterium]|nr:YjbH domain-containing protein [Bacteroidales bacterium]